MPVIEANSTAAWKARIAKVKKVRRELAAGAWADSVMFRKGEPFTDDSDADRVNINLDWSKTKSKHANLFSQVPQINLLPRNPQFAPAVPIFAKKLNDTLTKAKLGAAVDEAVLDTINAAGIGVIVVGYERLTEKKDVPIPTPETAAAMQKLGMKVPMKSIDVTTSERFPVDRLSPSDFLWPVEFTGSDFDKSPWIGRSGAMTWPSAKLAFNLTDEQKPKVINGGKPVAETIHQDTQRADEEGMVEFDEIYFWNYLYDDKEKHFEAIHRMVFVTGLDTPAVADEQWKGQKFNPQSNTYVGACEYPIRVLTLTYISDDAIPPSDSAIGRPQVLELIKSRSQMILQRDRSMPLRWHDVNRIDPAIEDAIMRGTFQGSIPTQGDGTRAIGEVSRASFPREDMEFDRIAKADLDEAWQTSANQAGATNQGQRSATEVGIVQQNFQTRVGYERARVGSFIVGIARVMAGYLALYGQWNVPQEMQAMEAWDRTTIAQEFVYDIFPDSTVLLDSGQKIQRLMGIVNMLGKSGLLELEPFVSKILSLAGEDPALMIKKPTPPPPPPVNTSLALKGEDLTSPLALAFLIHDGQAPSPQDLQAAQQMLVASQQPVQPPPPPSPMQPPGMGSPLPPAGGPGAGAPPPEPYPNDAGVMDKINKRGDHGG